MFRKKLARYAYAIACIVFMSGCSGIRQSNEVTIENVQTPINFNIVDRCHEYGISEEIVELLNIDSVNLLSKLICYTDSVELNTKELVVDYLKDINYWIQSLWTICEYGDSYLKITDQKTDSVGLTLYQNYDTFVFKVPFQCTIDLKDYPPEEVISEPNESIEKITLLDGTAVRVHRNIKSDDTLQWASMAHDAGFLPSNIVTPSNDPDDVITLYRFFYCYYAERNESKDIQTVSTALSMSDILSRKYHNWTLTIYIDRVEWCFGNYRFTMYGTNPDMILQLKRRNAHIINSAYPTDKLDVYSTQVDLSSGQTIVIIPEVEKLRINDLKIPKDIRKYPTVVKECFLHILYASKLYNLEEEVDATGFKISIKNYIDRIDMSDGLYECAVESTGSTSMQLVVGVKYKKRLYIMTIIPYDVYYRVEDIQ